ncbi:hypothetical protein BDN72DRAFT_829992 [Pluteus cervinus]|uniref:Uncharacterized protein n=1 Tax=Pluteus cervinus TaxID=181527 RepID=A0ACD3BF56_9AGAR|nr:hypothetical protein BDN72DRAFT_829992 [Pluteus cervinus]
MSEDEYENVQDDLSNLQNVDWDTLLDSSQAVELPPHQPPLNDTDSEYFPGDEPLNESLLAELDVLEHNLLHSTQADEVPGSSPAEASSSQTQADPSGSPRKRPRADSGPTIDRNNKRRSQRGPPSCEDLLSDFAEELTCPICFDLLAAAQATNPCGHSACGECGWAWVIGKNGGCAVCRRVLDKKDPLIPNIALDSMVAKYIQSMADIGHKEWVPGGSKYLEWKTRQNLWKDNASTRRKHSRKR